MKKHIFFTGLAACLLAACGDDVPNVEDPHNIVIEGKKVTQAEFLNKYCLGRKDNSTCLKVLQAKKTDATRGEMPKGW